MDRTMRESIAKMLSFIGDNPQRNGLVETPARVLNSWTKLYGGYGDNPERHLKKVFEDDCDEMVILRDVEFYSTCEHHMLPFFGKAHIGYIPLGRVVGISKLARVLEIYSRRLQIQERIGQQVAQAIMGFLTPKGCGVVLEAQHFCMTARGVGKQNSIMTTSCMRGVFREDPKTRAEFLRMIGK